MDSIYLDHNSTTPLLPEVADAITEALRAGYANPASQHQPGRRARRKLEETRDGIAEILGAKTTGMDADRLIFTSGGTEANNLALFGLAGEQQGRLIISSIEHPSVVGPAEQLAQRGWQLDRAGVSPDGVLDLDQLRELLADSPASNLGPAQNAAPSLVSIMLANNETGTMQPLADVAEICRVSGALLHTDAVQVAGKLPVAFRQLGVHAMTVNAHKYHGPRGIGALVVRHGVELQPIVYGGFQQAGLRPGTEDVVLAVGMLQALQCWQREADARASRMTDLRDQLEHLIRAGDPAVVINGGRAPRLPHTSNVSFPGTDRQALLMALDLAGVACSTGSACASGSSQASPVLLAMGCEKVVVEGSLRISLGATTTSPQVVEAARRILRIVNDLRSGKKAGNSVAAPRKAGPGAI